MNSKFHFKTNSLEYDIEAHAQFIGKDLSVCIWGGDSPHIGAVAAAHPRPSLGDISVTSATASIICFSGHKEDHIAKIASERLASALNTQVVVTAGIHWDNLSEYGIKMVNQNSLTLINDMISQMTALT